MTRRYGIDRRPKTELLSTLGAHDLVKTLGVFAPPRSSPDEL